MGLLPSTVESIPPQDDLGCLFVLRMSLSVALEMAMEQSELVSPELGSAPGRTMLEHLQKRLTPRSLSGSIRPDTSRDGEAMTENGTETGLGHSLRKSRLLGVSLTRKPNGDGSSEGSRSSSYRERVGAFRPHQLTEHSVDGNVTAPEVELPTSRIPRPSRLSSGSVQDGPLGIGRMTGAERKSVTPISIDVAKLLGGKDLREGKSPQPVNGKLVPIESRLRSILYQEHSGNKFGMNTRVLQSITGNREASLNISTDDATTWTSHQASVDHADNLPFKACEEKEFKRKTKHRVLVDGKSKSSSLNEFSGSHGSTLSSHNSDDKENGRNTVYFSEVSQNSSIPRDCHEDCFIKCTQEEFRVPEHSDNHIDTQDHDHTMKHEDIIENVDSPLPVYCEVIEWASYNGWRVVLVGVACILLLLSSVPPVALRGFLQVQNKSQKFERTNFDLVCDPLSPIMHVCMLDPDDLTDIESGGLCKTMPEIVFGLQKCPSLSSRAKFKVGHVKGTRPHFYSKLHLADLHKNILLAFILLGIGFSVCIIITAWCLA